MVVEILCSTGNKIKKKKNNKKKKILGKIENFVLNLRFKNFEFWPNYKEEIYSGIEIFVLFDVA